MSAARAALQAIFAGQDGLVEVAPAGALARRHCLDSPQDLIERLDEFGYFGPLPRKRRPGRTKDDVSDLGRVLWIDADVGAKDTTATTDQVDGLLDHLRARWTEAKISPSVAVYSGNRGWHLYWLLDQPIPKGEIEDLNRRLSAWFASDHVWEANRLLRVPSSRHELTGKTADIVHLHRVRLAPEVFWELPAVPICRPKTVLTDEPRSPIVEITGAYPAYPYLPDYLQAYVDAARASGVDGYDRSLFELRIITHLAACGWSDDEIIGFAHREQLPRHYQEWRRRRPADQWIRMQIHASRAFLRARGVETSESGGPTFVGGDEVPVGYTSSSWKQAQREPRYVHANLGELILLVRGQTVGELLREIKEAVPCTESSAKRHLRRFEHGSYVSKRKEGRNVYVSLTEKGERAVNWSGVPGTGNTIYLPHIDGATYPDGLPKMQQFIVPYRGQKGVTSHTHEG